MSEGSASIAWVQHVDKQINARLAVEVNRLYAQTGNTVCNFRCNLLAFMGLHRPPNQPFPLCAPMVPPPRTSLHTAGVTCSIHVSPTNIHAGLLLAKR
jgi:hypothetical protein